MKKVLVFCGSSSGTDDAFEQTAYRLGAFLASRDIGVVYGGAKVGLMGAVANGALDNGGEVIGILPKFLSAKELAHPDLTQFIEVETMHERKAMMSEMADGIIALPGGFGTLEELFEVLTWAQLGLHQKPIGIMNVDGFFESLLAFLQTMVDKGFLKKANKDMLLTADNIEELFQKMSSYQPPTVEKWLKKENV